MLGVVANMDKRSTGLKLIGISMMFGSRAIINWNVYESILEAKLPITGMYINAVCRSAGYTDIKIDSSFGCLGAVNEEQLDPQHIPKWKSLAWKLRLYKMIIAQRSISAFRNDIFMLYDQWKLTELATIMNGVANAIVTDNLTVATSKATVTLKRSIEVFASSTLRKLLAYSTFGSTAVVAAFNLAALLAKISIIQAL